MSELSRPKKRRGRGDEDDNEHEHESLDKGFDARTNQMICVLHSLIYIFSLQLLSSITFLVLELQLVRALTAATRDGGLPLRQRPAVCGSVFLRVRSEREAPLGGQVCCGCVRCRISGPPAQLLRGGGVYGEVCLTD